MKIPQREAQEWGISKAQTLFWFQLLPWGPVLLVKLLLDTDAEESMDPLYLNPVRVSVSFSQKA